MLFDDNISDTVSISRIIDHFLETDETPNVVVSYLSMYGQSEIEDILESSFLCSRIFQLDFISRLGSEELLRYTEIVRKICDTEFGPNITKDSLVGYAVVLIWQVLQSNLPDEIKETFRRVYFSRFRAKNLQHPYAGRIGNEISIYDTPFKDANRDKYEIFGMVSEMKSDKFEWYVKNSHFSLWNDRMMQSDFLNTLPIEKMFVVLTRRMKMASSSTDYLKFFMNVMFSSIENCIRAEAYKAFAPYRLDMDDIGKRYFGEELFNAVVKSNSYSEMMMELSVMGIEDCLNEAFALLLLYGRNGKTGRILGEFMKDTDSVSSLRYDFSFLNGIE